MFSVKNSEVYNSSTRCSFVRSCVCGHTCGKSAYMSRHANVYVQTTAYVYLCLAVDYDQEGKIVAGLIYTPLFLAEPYSFDPSTHRLRVLFSSPDRQSPYSLNALCVRIILAEHWFRVGLRSKGRGGGRRSSRTYGVAAHRIASQINQMPNAIASNSCSVAVIKPIVKAKCLVTCYYYLLYFQYFKLDR